jgi:hypothetical protein
MNAAPKVKSLYSGFKLRYQRQSLEPTRHYLREKKNDPGRQAREICSVPAG